MDATKRCRHCKQVLSLDQFHRWARSPDGHRPECKSCRGVKTPKGTVSALRVCASCGEAKEADAFRARHRGGLQSWCLACEATERRGARGGVQRATRGSGEQEQTKRREARAAAREAARCRVAAVGEKVCARCHRSLPVGSFWCSARSADGYRAACRGCSEAARHEIDPEDAERVARWAARNAAWDTALAARLREDL